jgi:heme A synthase
MNRAVETGVTTSFDTRLAALALTSLLSVIVLVMAGSFVRVTGYGLGCPDWPLCYGRAVPPLDIGAWVEFGHRFLGLLVSVQIAALTWLSYKYHRHESWIWPLAAATAVLLIVQVVLGGLHVLNELPRWTGLVHTGVASAIVGLLAFLVAVTRPEIIALSSHLRPMTDSRKIRLWSSICLGSSYFLILSGSLVTRTGASLACPNFPLCGISDVPENLQNLVTIQMVHRIIALSVAIAIAYFVTILLRIGNDQRILRILCYTVISLLVFQIGLGISNVLLSLPLWSRILHLGVATTIWAIVVLLAVICRHPIETTDSTSSSAGSVSRVEGIQ